ncbi:amidophosphoribosyltransferase [Gammaproteobacteria bacterium]|nr:amidophosphoribosyltransferase [Gammaproteobacteria bacterium]
MCGVIGIVESRDVPVNQLLYDGLTVIQHRGQDAAGIVTSDGERLFLRKDNGLVRDVFSKHHMRQLEGFCGVGHCRYPTAGCDSRAEAQPFYVNAPFGIALGHNGNLTNVDELRDKLFREDHRHLNTSSDSEVLLNVFAHELRVALGRDLTIRTEHIEEAVAGVYRRCRGAFAAVAMIVGYGIVAFRDLHGIRPLCYGRRPGGKGVCVASESVALDVLGFELVDDVKAGEMLIMRNDGEVIRRQIGERVGTPCAFEYVYLARPDSIVDGVSVHQARMRMGELLGRRILDEWPDHDITAVIPVPDTSRSSALQLAHVLDVRYREGFIKNRYIGRTFIMPGQAVRKKSVRQKLNPMESEFVGQNVLLVDDSIVRGTTSRQIVEMARECGAKKVYFASAAPPVRYPNLYGIDMPATSELIASGHDEDEIAAALGVDRIFYQTIADLKTSIEMDVGRSIDLEASCFDSIYVTGDVDDTMLRQVALRRDEADNAPPGLTKNLDYADLQDSGKVSAD